MKTRIQKWGNSLALRIPKSFAQRRTWSKARWRGVDDEGKFARPLPTGYHP